MDEALISATSLSSAVSSPPSSPLTVLSQSPSPPSSPRFDLFDHSKRYPSPSPTSKSGSVSPRKPPFHDAADEPQRRGDGPSPTKKRRVQPPRPRTTRHIDLENTDEEDDAELNYLLRALRTKKKIVVVAGAGISVSAGIPDFRSSTGLFTTLRGQNGHRGSGKHLFDASVYKHDSSTESFHSMVRELAHMTQKARPTAFHHLLASLAHEGRLLRLYSQNIDCIETSLEPLATQVPLNTKAPWPVTIQLHGGLEKMVCSKCGELEDFDGSLFEGPEPPPCKRCAEVDEVRAAAAQRSHGIGRLRPRIVLYNEYNPDEEAIGNVSKADLRRRPDAVLVVGTSLKIPGVRRLVKELCQVTRSSRDGLAAWINVDAEPQGVEFKHCWDYVVRGSCDDIAALTGLPHWDQQDIGSPSSWMVTGEGHKHGDLEVVLDDATLASSDIDKTPTRVKKEEDGKAEAKPFHMFSATSIPTPTSSPKPRRRRLPDSKPGGSGGRQSRLPFQLAKGADSSSADSVKAEKDEAAKPKAKSVAKKDEVAAKKPKKPRQPKAKKEASLLASNMPLSFRATKMVRAAVPAAKQEKPLPLPLPLKKTPQTPPLQDCTKLPSLRDGISGAYADKENNRGNEGCYATARSSPPRYREVHTPPPASHKRRASEAETISPGSKPRGMGTLID